MKQSMGEENKAFLQDAFSADVCYWPILDFAPYAVCGVGATSRWPLDRKVLGCRHRLTAPSETPGDAANFIARLVTAKAFRFDQS